VIMSKEIKLTQGQIAIVDNEDYDRVKGYTWFANNWTGSSKLLSAKTWVEKGGKRHLVSLHRFLLNLPSNSSVLFRNDNPLDCRRSNMEIVTPKDACRTGRLKRNNTSGYKGVTWSTQKGRWRAFIKVDRRQIHLGFFDDPVEAAHAYDDAARKYFGKFARLNFPREGERSVNEGRPAQPEVTPYPREKQVTGPRWTTHNPTGFKGVFIQPSGRYCSCIWIKGKYRHLGTFDVPEETALAFDEASREKYGDQARLNFPKPGEAGCRAERPLKPAA
jgi:hypothetical protein